MRPLLVLALLAMAACNDMDTQPREKDYRASALFSDGKALQAPPDGTVSRDDLALRAALTDRPPLTAALLQRGQQRYGIYCAPCHDSAGTGHGTVPDRGFPEPPSFHIDRLRQASSAYVVDVITHGHGVMYSYADRVAPADRWAIAAYIRALQLSQDAAAADLPDAERARLEADHAP
jgi:mono/diheme cytochrome c family protein